MRWGGESQILTDEQKSMRNVCPIEMHVDYWD